MIQFLIAVDAPHGPGRVELSNARFGKLEFDASKLQQWKFGDCDEQNLRFDRGRQTLFTAVIEPTAREWFVRLYGAKDECYMWFQYKGVKYNRNYGDEKSSKYDFEGRSDALVLSGQEIASFSAEVASIQFASMTAEAAVTK